jgi:hypothetical protein
MLRWKRECQNCHLRVSKRTRTLIHYARDDGEEREVNPTTPFITVIRKQTKKLCDYCRKNRGLI